MLRTQDDGDDHDNDGGVEICNEDDFFLEGENSDSADEHGPLIIHKLNTEVYVTPF